MGSIFETRDGELSHQGSRGPVRRAVDPGCGFAQSSRAIAYYSMFHLAEAYIFERSEKVAKTHTGVRAEIARLSRDQPGFDPTFGDFLAKSYKYKEIADYGVGVGDVIARADAEDAVAQTTRFIEFIATLLAQGGDPSERR